MTLVLYNSCRLCVTLCAKETLPGLGYGGDQDWKIIEGDGLRVG